MRGIMAADETITDNRQAVLLDNIPAELKELDCWVCWCLEAGDDGRITKVPYQPRGQHRKAKSNDSTTWGTYERAVKHFEANPWVTGLGICFSGRLCGVDLDHCVTDGKIAPWAAQVVAELDTYTELSQSGSGIHCLCLGDLPEGRRNVRLPELGQDAGIEMYGAGSPKFFVVTGRVIP
jgi:putative DNA primase/helicase